MYSLGAPYARLQQIAIMLSAPILGWLADRHGRRVILVISLFVSIIPSVFLLMAQRDSFFLTFYFVFFSVTGLIYTIPILLTCVADISHSTNRAGNFGIIMASTLLGYTVTPKILNYFSDACKSKVSIGFFVSAAFYSLFFFEETRAPDKAPEAVSIITSLVEAVKDLKILNRNRVFRNLSLCIFFSTVVQEASFQLQIYFLKDNFDMSDNEISNIFLVFGLCSLLIQGGE